MRKKICSSYEQVDLIDQDGGIEEVKKLSMDAVARLL